MTKQQTCLYQCRLFYQKQIKLNIKNDAEQQEKYIINKNE